MSTFNLIAGGNTPLEDNDWKYIDGVKIAWNSYTSKKINTVLIKGGTSSVWIVGGVKGQLASSTDRITWTDRTLALTSAGWSLDEDIVCGTTTFSGYGTGQFILCGSEGSIAHSADGLNWIVLGKIYQINSSYTVSWSQISVDILKITQGVYTGTYLTEVPTNAPQGTTRLRGDLNGSGAITSSDGITAINYNSSPPTSGWAYDYIQNDINVNNPYLSVTPNNSWYIENFSDSTRHLITSIEYIPQINKLLIGGAFGQLAVFQVSETTKLTTWTSIDIKQIKLIDDSYYDLYVPHLRNIPILSISWAVAGTKQIFLFGSSNNCFWACDENLEKFFLKVCGSTEYFNEKWFGTQAETKELSKLKVIKIINSQDPNLDPTLDNPSKVYISKNLVKIAPGVTVFFMTYVETGKTRLLIINSSAHYIVQRATENTYTKNNVTPGLIEQTDNLSKFIAIDIKNRLIDETKYDLTGVFVSPYTQKTSKFVDKSLNLSVSPENTLEKIWPNTSQISYSSNFNYYTAELGSSTNTINTGTLVAGTGGEVCYLLSVTEQTNDWTVNSLSQYLTDTEVASTKLSVNGDNLHLTSIINNSIKNVVFNSSGSYLASYPSITNYTSGQINDYYSNGTATYLGCNNGIVLYIGGNYPSPVLVSNYLRTSTSWGTVQKIDSLVFNESELIVFGYTTSNSWTIFSRSTITPIKNYLTSNGVWSPPTALNGWGAGIIPKKAVWTGSKFILIGNHSTNGTYYSTSSDGVLWTSPVIITGWSGIQCVSAVYEPVTGTVCVVGPSGKVSVSTDSGSTWTEKTTALTSTGWSTTSPTGVICYNSKIVLYGSSGKLAESSDGGTSWTYNSTLSANIGWNNRIILSAASSSSKLFALGNSTGVLASSII